MKECVYGWYPPAKDIYKQNARNKTQNTYERECLYNHGNSRYNSKPGVATPVKARHFHLRSRPSTTSSRSASARVEDGLRTTSSQGPALRATSVPLYRFSPSPPKSPITKKAWCMNIPATPVTTDTYTPLPLPTDTTPVVSESPDAVKKTRAKSAPVYRAKTNVQRRPVKSASPVRSLSRLSLPQERPQAPVPETSVDEKFPAPPVSEYEQRLDRYGWRMEVHGDPLNLKRPCLPKRLSYTVKVGEPDIPPNPPKAHMESCETFFYNTIPRKPLSFTIHPEWISEVLFAKRLDLQKREGYKFRRKDFSFVY